MLTGFAMVNSRPIKTEQAFSLFKSKRNELKHSNVFQFSVVAGSSEPLRSTAIYNLSAAGKSSLVRALEIYI